MAWPVVNDHIAVICRTKLRGGVDAKTFSNTFYFRNDALTINEGVESAIDALVAFYNGLHSGGRLTNFMSAALDPNYVFTGYDLGQAPPRVPVDVRTVDMAPTAITGLPHEVAVCLSYKANPPNTPSRRGRVYLGPLANNSNVIDHSPTTATPSAGPQIGAQFRLTAKAAAVDLRDTTENVAWVVLSQIAPGSTAEISNGWIDLDFDTQRRRGGDVSTKDLWGV